MRNGLRVDHAVLYRCIVPGKIRSVCEKHSAWLQPREPLLNAVDQDTPQQFNRSGMKTNQVASHRNPPLKT